MGDTTSLDEEPMRIRHFHVRPNIPKELAPLEEIARNLWFSWSWEAVQLFIRLNPVLWEQAYQNPVQMLGYVAAGGPRSRREGRELRRERRAGVPVVPGVPEEDVVVPGGSRSGRRRPGGLFLLRVRDRRGAPDLLRGARSPLGRPPEVGIRPRDPACRRRAPVPEGIFPPGAVAGRVAEGAVPGQRLVQHAGDDGEGGGWPPPGDRGGRRRRGW